MRSLELSKDPKCRGELYPCLVYIHWSQTSNQLLDTYFLRDLKTGKFTFWIWCCKTECTSEMWVAVRLSGWLLSEPSLHSSSRCAAQSPKHKKENQHLSGAEFIKTNYRTFRSHSREQFCKQGSCVSSVCFNLSVGCWNDHITLLCSLLGRKSRAPSKLRAEPSTSSCWKSSADLRRRDSIGGL